MSESLKDARASVVRLLKAYTRAPSQGRTQILRDLAEAIVEARQFFQRPDGAADLTGTSHAYRQWLRESYESAGIQKDERPTLQAMVRYHVNNALRDHFDEATLAEYGMDMKTARDRAADRRHASSAVLSALTSKDQAGGAMVSLPAAWTLLSKVEPEDIRELDADAAEVAVDILNDIKKKSTSLLRNV